MGTVGPWEGADGDRERQLEDIFTARALPTGASLEKALEADLGRLSQRLDVLQDAQQEKVQRRSPNRKLGGGATQGGAAALAGWNQEKYQAMVLEKARRKFLALEQRRKPRGLPASPKSMMRRAYSARSRVDTGIRRALTSEEEEDFASRSSVSSYTQASTTSEPSTSPDSAHRDSYLSPPTRSILRKQHRRNDGRRRHRPEKTPKSKLLVENVFLQPAPFSISINLENLLQEEGSPRLGGADGDPPAVGSPKSPEEQPWTPASISKEVPRGAQPQQAALPPLAGHGAKKPPKSVARTQVALADIAGADQSPAKKDAATPSRERGADPRADAPADSERTPPVKKRHSFDDSRLRVENDAPDKRARFDAKNGHSAIDLRKGRPKASHKRNLSSSSIFQTTPERLKKRTPPRPPHPINFGVVDYSMVEPKVDTGFKAFKSTGKLKRKKAHSALTPPRPREVDLKATRASVTAIKLDFVQTKSQEPVLVSASPVEELIRSIQKEEEAKVLSDDNIQVVDISEAAGTAGTAGGGEEGAAPEARRWWQCFACFGGGKHQPRS